MACLDNKSNLGFGRCGDLPGLIRGIITTPASFKLSEEDAQDQTEWQAALVAARSSRIYLWPYFATVPEFIGTETTYEDTPVSYTHVLDGRYRWRAMISKSLCFHKAAFTHRSNGGDRVWLIDSRNNLIGTYVGDEGGVAQYAGFTMDVLHTENLMFNDGSVSTKTPIVIALKEPNEVNDSVYGAHMIAASFLNLLAPLTDVVLAIVGSPTSSEVVVSVKVKCDGTPVTGLVLADFVYPTETITTVTETGEGVYTLAGTGFSTGTITLDDPDQLSVYPTSAYEANTVAVTI